LAHFAIPLQTAIIPAPIEGIAVMHYPHKTSKVKRARKIGFRARMRNRNGRKTINAKRRAGRKVQVV
jgi:large subunit ribosomal protein L34